MSWRSNLARSRVLPARDTWSEPIGVDVPPPASVCTENSAWKIGLRARSRPGCTASTSRSNGRSWFASAPCTVVRARVSNSLKVFAPSRLVRIASVLTKKPTTPSVSVRVRPATGVPTMMSSCPVSRWSSNWNAAIKTVNAVVPCERAMALTRAPTSAGISTDTCPPVRSRSMSRGLSVGRSSVGRGCARVAIQYASCASSAPLSRCSRCQAA